MLDFFGSISSFSLARRFEQRQIHALTGIDGGNGDILTVLHNPLHLDELHLRSRCNVLDIEPTKRKNVHARFMDMTHAGRALAQPWLVFADPVDPVFGVSIRS